MNLAGRPKRRALIQQLTKLAAEELEDGNAHLEYVVRWIENGGTTRDLAKLITEGAGEEITGSYVTRYLNDVYPDTYGPAMTAARSVGAFAIVEETQDIADDLTHGLPDKNKTAIAKLRIDTRLWMAERYNRKELGAPKDQAVVINIGSLHMDALRSRSTARVTAPSSETDTGLTARPRAYQLGAGAADVADEYADVAVEVVED